MRKLPFRHLVALVLLASATLLILSALAPGTSSPHVADQLSNTVVNYVQHSPLPNNFSTQHPGELIGRPLYPYSVVPGGVQSGKELESAIANDPVVAKHYSSFDFSKARVVRLEKGRTAYVSYRIGEQVFWTKKRMQLAKGEALVTDGAQLARTRCGNQVSETPRVPVSPVEPTTEALNTTLEPPLFAEELPLDLPVQPAPPTQIAPIEQPETIYIPPIIPVYWFGGSGPGPRTGPPPPPPPPVPEPGTLLLLSTGLCVAWLILKNRAH